ncbi:MAG: hypothetical protein ACLPPO_31995, partial [Mycobacterium sp.]
MRTPVILVAGQKDTDPVVGTLLRTPGTLIVEHRFDGHVVRRTMVGIVKLLTWCGAARIGRWGDCGEVQGLPVSHRGHRARGVAVSP